MCDIIIKVGLIVLLAVLLIGSEFAAYFGGGYVVKAWRVGYVVRPNDHEQTTPREIRHFWDFNQDDAIVAVVAWNGFLMFLALVFFVAYTGITIITQGVTFTIDRFCITPVLGCLCGGNQKTRFRMRRVSDSDTDDMYDLEEV